MTKAIAIFAVLSLIYIINTDRSRAQCWMIDWEPCQSFASPPLGDCDVRLCEQNGDEKFCNVAYGVIYKAWEVVDRNQPASLGQSGQTGWADQYPSAHRCYESHPCSNEMCEGDNCENVGTGPFEFGGYYFDRTLTGSSCVGQ